MENLEEKALEIIETVDYDIFKECLMETEENGYSDIVDSVMSILETFQKDIQTECE